MRAARWCCLVVSESSCRQQTGGQQPAPADLRLTHYSMSRYEKLSNWTTKRKLIWTPQYIIDRQRRSNEIEYISSKTYRNPRDRSTHSVPFRSDSPTPPAKNNVSPWLIGESCANGQRAGHPLNQQIKDIRWCGRVPNDEVNTKKRRERVLFRV